MLETWVTTAAAAFAGNDDTICQQSVYDFALAPLLADTTDCDSLLWITSGLGTFNDSRLLHPVYTLDPLETGDIVFSLVGYGIDPCGNDTSIMVLTINPIPNGSIAFNPADTCCVNEVVGFTGSDNSGTTITNWDWDFADGNTSTVQNPTHTYTSAFANAQNVSLTLTNSDGCTNTSYQQIMVTNPSISFNINPATACFGDTTGFDRNRRHC